jgi:cyclopropane-fatty-acyl-phospholipid synthase
MSSDRSPATSPPRSIRGRRTVASEADRAVREVTRGKLAHPPVPVRFWDGSQLGGGGDGNGDGPVVVADDHRAVSHLLYQPGQLGLARAWVDGSLTVHGDLEQVRAKRRQLEGIRLSALDRVRLVWAALRMAGPPVLRRPPIPSIEARVRGRRHSLERDRSAVRHHYDVSNDFYRLVLGPTMVYSCAYFHSEADSLEVAQERKLDLICRKLQLAPGDRLLDVGCGWGSLVLHAAARYGVRAVGVTLSEPQARLARERAREQGLSHRVDIRVADYRELAGEQFDKIASVGMYEHVGRAELKEYVGRIAALLRPGGLFLNHGITRLYSQAPTSDTFITRYVFPDGELHPISDLTEAMQAAGFEVRDTESLRDHYPLTLRRWVANLLEHREQATAIAGPERVRAWHLYMLGSAQGFEDEDIAIYQVLSVRHGAPGNLPLDRMELLADARPVGSTVLREMAGVGETTGA